MAHIPSDWLSPARMQRVIVHWTAGGHKASALDRSHYHILVEDDGRVVRGDRAISANARITKLPNGSWSLHAAHTRMKNTGSIGVAVCCMLDAHERPFRAGRAPMTPRQWEVLAEVTAELCDAYRIEVTPATVLGHGEVEKNLGVMQRGKWDPLKLPWEPGLSLDDVGHLFRKTVRDALHDIRGGARGGTDEPDEPVLQIVAVVIREHRFEDALIENAAWFVRASDVQAVFDVTIDERLDHHMRVTLDKASYEVPYTEFNGKDYVDCEDLARIFGLTLSWNEHTRVLTLA